MTDCAYSHKTLLQETGVTNSSCINTSMSGSPLTMLTASKTRSTIPLLIFSQLPLKLLLSRQVIVIVLCEVAFNNA